MTSQDLFKSQELPELAATVELTKEVQTQPNCLPQTMPESPMIQSFVIKPANPKAGCIINNKSVSTSMLVTHFGNTPEMSVTFT